VKTTLLRRRTAVLGLVVVVSLLHWALGQFLPPLRIGDGSAERMPKRIEVAYVRELAPAAPPPAAPVVVAQRASPRPKAVPKPVPAASAPQEPTLDEATVADAAEQLPSLAVAEPAPPAVAASQPATLEPPPEAVAHAASDASAPAAFE